MELRQLRYLIGIHEAGGVLAASRSLHIAQPALSQSMAALEAELDAKLFLRSNRGMTLTDAGKSLLEHARIVLADVDRARDAVHRTGTQIQGQVSIGLPTTVALVATLPILQAAHAHYPGIRLKIIESHSGFLSEWLKSGRLDTSVLFVTDRDAALASHPLLQERLALVTRPGPKTPKTRFLALRKLADLPLLLPSKEHGLRRIVDDACARANVALNVIAEVDSLPNIKKAVQTGMAATILSPGSVAEELAAGSLAITPIRSPQLSRQIACATSLARPMTPAIHATVELIRQQLRTLVESGTWPARWIATKPASQSPTYGSTL
ncbi:LysR substrate-binding domain-containing protein [Bordetella sp. FB-8]|uniref:LysR substrate-binding domain-containing protein n=1 Tax=Bordetella sp. FB-8 TaxID=1159870 RepID=UPI0003670D40|nr:LysR substrate-binding domain-containing protein [Bordetella sp. FB-8]